MPKMTRAKAQVDRESPPVRLSRRRQSSKPVARWLKEDGRRLLVLENSWCRVTLWPGKGGAIVSYIDRASGLDIIWRNAYGQPPRAQVIEQPMRGSSELYDVMDGSWYVSLPNGFFAGDYFGAPLGTHGELRCLPWDVKKIVSTEAEIRVELLGISVRTPLIYHRELTLGRTSGLMQWRETLQNRWSRELPVAWLHHPAFGGPLLDGARLIAPARTVSVFRADDPKELQLRSGYRGTWPFVPERKSGRLRDCSIVPPASSGLDHSVQLTDFETGTGCVWNERLRLGFALEWDLKVFPYAWSWSCGGGRTQYPLWDEGHLVTLQPSTSPVGRFPDLLRDGGVLRIPACGTVSTTLTTGFVHSPSGPWTRMEATR